jgi:hypothetical protein
MDFLSRLLGASQTQKKAAHRAPVNDPQARLLRFKRLYNHLVELCNRPRKLSDEWPVLQQLYSLQKSIAAVLREETRAPSPHLCLQFCASNKIYTVISRAASVSQNEAVIHSAITIFAALADSDEVEFLSSDPFAKSLMRLVTKVADSGGMLIGVDTETSIFELLFTISAKIRLQPGILPVWFRSTVKKAGLDDVFAKDGKDFAGITQKDDFPLCYLLIDRIHHEGRIGDFARTGLLYIFEATGRSSDLAEWVVLSDLPTLMASGLGALYSQLSRELSILHPDATLPAVLAMSDYSTTNPRPDAESAFSERHQAHMATFLSYLAFWQDVLDHCRSVDVKQTLLDHFQILFVQQLLYPSVLQSSDTDAGSSVAVLTYLTAMLESLEYPVIIRMMLTYLLNVKEDQDDYFTGSTAPETPERSSGLPRSPTTIRRRQSLMLLTAPKDPDAAVEPSLFNLVDLVLNSVGSRNHQTAYAALKLLSTTISRQKRFAFGTLLKVQRVRSGKASRLTGALDTEVNHYMDLAATVCGSQDGAASAAYAGLVEDLRYTVEGQALFQPSTEHQTTGHQADANTYLVQPDDILLRRLQGRLRTWFTNSVDVNLALTQAIISIASCIELRLDTWLALDPTGYKFDNEDHAPPSAKPWKAFAGEEENSALAALKAASRRPVWSGSHAPLIYSTLDEIAHELEVVRNTVPNLDQLLAGRANMLQAAGIEPASPSGPPSLIHSPTQAPSLIEAARPKASRSHSRSSSASSIRHERGRKATISAIGSPSPLSRSSAASPMPIRPSDIDSAASASARSIYQPPPPETPSTTDILMQKLTFPAVASDHNEDVENEASQERTASLNHVLTNIVILQEFILELVAVLQVRAAVLGEKEVRCV